MHTVEKRHQFIKRGKTRAQFHSDRAKNTRRYRNPQSIHKTWRKMKERDIIQRTKPLKPYVNERELGRCTLALIVDGEQALAQNNNGGL